MFTDTIVFETGLARIGAFRCHRGDPNFRDTGPANNDCFVFPRTAVKIEHEHEPPFATNPNIVTFYNRQQTYLRYEISDRGDLCDWFGVDRDLARDVVRAFDPSVEERPFRWTRGPCEANTYLLQRQVFDMVRRGAHTDPLAVEETIVTLLERVVNLAISKPLAQAKVRWAHREIVDAAECLLSAQFDRPLSLSDIARQIGTSVYHLCRTFRKLTGLPLHQYRQQLRLRHGLEMVCETDAALSRVAVDLGYAHHSHFTSAFHREFGNVPSEVRKSFPFYAAADQKHAS